MSRLKRRIERLTRRRAQCWAVIHLIDVIGYTQEGRAHVVLREGPERTIVEEHFGHVGEPVDALIDRLWPDAISPNLGMA